MAVPSKSIVTPDPMVLQEILAGVGAVFSAVLDFSGKFACSIAWDFAPLATTATPAATVLQILGATNLISGVVDSADDHWEVIQDWLSPTAVPTEFTAVAGTAGTSTITVASVVGLVLYQDHFIEGATVNEAGSEWVFPVSFSGTTITIRGTLKNTYSGATMRSGAMKQSFDLDLFNRGKIKFMIGNNRGTDRDVAIRVRVLTLDAIA